MFIELENQPFVKIILFDITSDFFKKVLEYGSNSRDYYHIE